MEKLKQPQENLESAPDMKKFKVFFIRHGKPIVASENYGTDHMPFDEFEEAIDVARSMNLPLSEKGVEEILASLRSETHESLSNTKLIVSSPYLRTKQTAGIVSDYIFEQTGVRLGVNESELLKEVELGKDTITRGAYESIMNKEGYLGIANYYDALWTNGGNPPEGISDTFARAQRFLTYLRRIRKWTTNDTVFVSTHGWIGRMIKHVAEGGDIDGYHTKTRMLKMGEIFSFDEDDLIKLEGIGKE